MMINWASVKCEDIEVGQARWVKRKLHLSIRGMLMYLRMTKVILYLRITNADVPEDYKGYFVPVDNVLINRIHITYHNYNIFYLFKEFYSVQFGIQLSCRFKGHDKYEICHHHHHDQCIIITASPS